MEFRRSVRRLLLRYLGQMTQWPSDVRLRHRNSRTLILRHSDSRVCRSSAPPRRRTPHQLRGGGTSPETLQLSVIIAIHRGIYRDFVLRVAVD